MRRWGGCATAGLQRAAHGAGRQRLLWPQLSFPPAGKLDVRFSITVRQHASLRDLIEAIPEEDWTPIPILDGRRRRCCRDDLHPRSRPSPDAAPVRLIVRRVKPTPGSQLALFARYSYHGFITRPRWGDAGAGGRSSPPRRDRERHTRPQVRRRAEPHAVGAFRRQRRLAGDTGDGA